MDLKKKLRQIRNYINEQQVHDDQKFNIKRTRLINFIYSLELDEVKRFKETKTTETTNKTMKEQKINDVKNNQSLFTEEEINKLLEDIKEVERISNDFKRGVLTNEEALKEATDLKEQFYNKKERTIY
ncbi:MAG: hypothetical protein MR411_04715 [Tenericutes bacterium]|nr:hypothetical protein [Mycoplasmatota bacterium]MDY3800874.1 hypothetical protein [Bacilli bacterium]